MGTQLPDCPAAADGLAALGSAVKIILLHAGGRAKSYVIAPEADQRDIKSGLLQRRQLGTDQRHIPVSHFGQPVVRQRIGPQLLRRQMLDPDTGELLPSLGLRRHQTAMPGDDVVLAVNENRRYRAELAQRPLKLFQLVLRVRSRVIGIRPELADGDLLKHCGLSHAATSVILSAPCIRAALRRRPGAPRSMPQA